MLMKMSASLGKKMPSVAFCLGFHHIFTVLEAYSLNSMTVAPRDDLAPSSLLSLHHPSEEALEARNCGLIPTMALPSYASPFCDF